MSMSREERERLLEIDIARSRRLKAEADAEARHDAVHRERLGTRSPSWREGDGLAAMAAARAEAGTGPSRAASPSGRPDAVRIRTPATSTRPRPPATTEGAVLPAVGGLSHDANGNPVAPRAVRVDHLGEPLAPGYVVSERTLRAIGPAFHHHWEVGGAFDKDAIQALLRAQQGSEIEVIMRRRAVLDRR